PGDGGDGLRTRLHRPGGRGADPRRHRSGAAAGARRRARARGDDRGRPTPRDAGGGGDAEGDRLAGRAHRGGAGRARRARGRRRLPRGGRRLAAADGWGLLMAIAAIDRNDVALFVDNVFLVYIIMIFAAIAISWVVTFRGSLPYNRPLRAVTGFLDET